MSNHLHLLASAKEKNLPGILRDFKKFTSKQIIAAIQNNEYERRKDWMINIFKEKAKVNSRHKTYQFRRQDNQPKECYSAAFTVQKLIYIHNNHVDAGLVANAEDYLYSSAKTYLTKDGSLLEIDCI